MSTTWKTYYGTHDGPFLGIAPTRRKAHCETMARRYRAWRDNRPLSDAGRQLRRLPGCAVMLVKLALSAAVDL